MPPEEGSEVRQPIPLPAFPGHVERMHWNEHCGFVEEYRVRHTCERFLINEHVVQTLMRIKQSIVWSPVLVVCESLLYVYNMREWECMILAVDQLFHAEY